MLQVADKAKILFTEVLISIRQIAESKFGAGSVDSGMELESSRRFTELEAVLQMEKTKFEVTS